MSKKLSNLIGVIALIFSLLIIFSSSPPNEIKHINSKFNDSYYEIVN